MFFRCIVLAFSGQLEETRQADRKEGRKEARKDKEEDRREESKNN